MSKKYGIIIGCLAGVALLLFFVFRVSQNSVKGPEPTPTPDAVKHLRDFENIEGEIHDGPPEIHTEQLPDGKRIEYGTLHGTLSPAQEEELKKIIEEEKQKQRPQSKIPPLFFNNQVKAAGPEDGLLIETETAPQSMVDHLRSLFTQRVFYWTQQDLAALTKIRIVDNKQTIGGALGAWNFVRIDNPDGTFSDIKGIIWIWKDGPIEEALIHEYGHHYTNYWAAHRSQGSWEFTNRWPPDSAGDYYQLRPLQENCQCASFSAQTCPYGNRIWEILAEDFRITASLYNTDHRFASVSCLSGGGAVGLPDKLRTSAYLAALPLSGGNAPIATVQPTMPVPSGSPSQCLGVQHCTQGSKISREYCGDCQGPGCVPGSCSDPSYTCATYQQKIFGADTLYPVSCLLLSPTPRPLSASDNVGVNTAYFPRIPFVACYSRGGVCTHQETCLRSPGTTFEKDTTVCPNSEGCCLSSNPSAVAPTQTPCETEGGICTAFHAACTMQGGALEDAKGCSVDTQCCKFPATSSLTYTNQEYQHIINQVKNGALGSLAVSAWIQHACRTPSLQTLTCDPTVPGDCERIECSK